MEITTEYSLGDTVWAGQFTSELVTEACSLCKGKGALLIEGYTVKCPVSACCYGKIRTGVHNWRLEVESLTIGWVGAETTKDKRKIQYMCEETGVGSGMVWAEALLFPTKEAVLQRGEEIRQQGMDESSQYMRIRREVEDNG